MRYTLIILMTIASILAAEDAKPLPRDVQKVIAAMEAQINKARQEAVSKLEKMVVDVTKKGDLDTAIAVKAKVKEIQDAMPQGDLLGDGVNPIVGKWKVIESGWIFEYKADGTSICFNNNVPGKWNVANNTMTVVWTNGNIDTLTLPIKNNTLSCSNNRGATGTFTKLSADTK